MNGDVGSASHFKRLMEIARQYRVEVHFLERSVASEVDWDGLYLVTREFGAGIAIRTVWNRRGVIGFLVTSWGITSGR